MNAQRVFCTDTGALRAPWRVLVFSAIALGCWLVAFVILEPTLGPLLGGLGFGALTVQTMSSCVGLLGGTAIMVRAVDRRPWADVWLDRRAARPRMLTMGFALGMTAIGLPILALIGTRWLILAPSAAGSWPVAAVRIAIFLVPAAFSEELLMRGYIFSVLREAWGWKSALVVTSLLFGALHILNAGANVESITLVTLAGLFLGAVLWATQSLYAVWMAHFAWNWTMAAVFHTAVSGLPMPSPGYRYVAAGPEWATGGQWGPEGGVPAAVGMALGLTILLVRRRQSGSSREI